MGFVVDYFGLEESPDMMTRMNAIIDFWEDPCDAPWHVYIETLYPVAGRLVLILVDFDTADLLRSCLRPSCSLRRGRPRRRRPRVWSTRVGLPETSDMLCGIMPFRGFFAGQNVGGLSKWLWRIDGVLQRLLWYWLVIDLAVDGFFWWATLIRRSEFCRRSERLGLMATSDTVFCTAFAGGNLPAGEYDLSYRDPGIAFNQHIVGIPEGRWELGIINQYENASPGEGFLKLGFEHAGAFNGTSGKIPQEGQATVSHIQEVNGPGLFDFRHQLTGALTCTGLTGSLWARRMW